MQHSDARCTVDDFAEIGVVVFVAAVADSRDRRAKKGSPDGSSFWHERIIKRGSSGREVSRRPKRPGLSPFKSLSLGSWICPRTFFFPGGVNGKEILPYLAAFEPMISCPTRMFERDPAIVFQQKNCK
jgi:hypothetical protein